MAEHSNRPLERKIDDPEALAELLQKRRLQGAEDAELSHTLRKFGLTFAHQVLELTDWTEGEKASIEVRAMMEDQIAFAQENAILPREDDASLPNHEDIMASIMRELTPERALEILQFHGSRLVLVPVTSVERYRQELSRLSYNIGTERGFEREADAYITSLAEQQLDRLATEAQVEGNKIKKWRFAITEGSRGFHVPEWDKAEDTLRQRIQHFNERYANSRMTRLDYQSYIALMFQGLLQGKPIDDIDDQSVTSSFTLLEELEGNLIGEGFFDRYRVDLGEQDIDEECYSGVFRPALTGDIGTSSTS